MYNTRSRGFTLIELLVVIAIIGILSAVVLASLNTARGKGNDAAARSNFDGARVQAELYYDANGNSYASVCNPGQVVNGVKGVYDQINGAASAESAAIDTSVTDTATAASPFKTSCHASAGAWGAEVYLQTAGYYYCIDSAGTAATSSTANGPKLAASEYAC